MISFLISLLLPHVGEKAAKPLAIALLVMAGIAFFFGAKAIYDASVVDDHVNEANVDILERKDQATGNANAASDERKARMKIGSETTKELIDEALENGCSVGEYLSSNGERCLQS